MTLSFNEHQQKKNCTVWRWVSLL